MLEVDAKVIAPDELVRRVRAVMDDGATSTQPQTGLAAEPTLQALRSVADHLQDLQDRFAVQPIPMREPPRLVDRAKQLSKRTLRKTVRWYLEPRLQAQSVFNVEAARFINLSALVVDQIRRDLDDLRITTRRAADLHQRTMERLLGVVTGARALTSSVQAVEGAMERVEGARRDSDAQLKALREQLATILQRLGAAGASGADIDYVAFEEQFRGASADLASSQREYLAYFAPADAPGLVVDIGCGRGEMVQVLLDAGYEAAGVDTDAGMVAVCREKGLPVEQESGLVWLESQPDDSLKGIFCAQVVEHLFTNELQRLIGLAHQKLQPGGVIIMETINPRSSHALGNHFFADTSHVRPVHPETLRFLCSAAGFERADFVGRSRHAMADLPPDADGALREAVQALLDSVFGDQDYAIVATK
jgi:2-polyprenyl-3-methyl-5-hydroxy-6-metoxy-1,4-benzoquinol methylase